MKRLTTGLSALCLLFSLSAQVSALKYAPPYEAAEGGRAAQNMPVPYTEESAPKQLLADNGTTGGLTAIAGTDMIGDDGVITITKTEDEKDKPKSVVFKYSNTTLTGGDTVALVCSIKTVGVSGASPRSIIAAYANGAWQNETHGYDGKKYTGDNDWYTMTQMLEVPEGTAYFNLTAYLAAGLIGTVQFKDFKLYRLAVDPMESVLCAPNYKGLLYGDGQNDIDLDVVLQEQNGFYRLSELSLSVQLVDGDGKVYRTAYAAAPQARMNFVFSSAGLAEGDYYLQTILTNKADGSVISKKEHTIRKRSSSYRPTTYADENGYIIQNGKKTFLKRIMNYNGNYQAAAEMAKSANIPVISHYGMWWASDAPETAALNYMRTNGIKSHICLSSYWISDLSGNMGTSLIREQSDILPFLTQVAEDYKNDDILDGYYLFDEPNPIYKGEEIRWNNEIMAQADIDHPTYGVADQCYDKYGVYVKMADVVGVDPYPISGAEDDDLAAVGRSVKQLKQNMPNRPVYAVLQGFNKAASGLDASATRSPNYQELRNMAWQALCEGAVGLDCYAWPDMQQDPSKDADTWLSELKSVYDEAESYSDILFSDEPAPSYRVTGGGDWLNLLVKRYRGKTYLFAVNNTKEAHNATVTLSGAGTRQLALEGLAVAIQTVEQGSYLSPEAELKSMAFSNGTETFAVGEGEVHTLYVPQGRYVINYSAEISDGATLYIGTLPRAASGKITVWQTDDFTVRVVAADGVTQSEQHYHVERY